MIIKIHTKSISGSGITKKGQQPGAMFGAFLEIDGEIYDMVNDIKVNFDSESFATVDVRFIAANVHVISHTEETWPSIERSVEERRGRVVARNSEGRTIAIYVSPASDGDSDGGETVPPAQA